MSPSGSVETSAAATIALVGGVAVSFAVGWVGMRHRAGVRRARVAEEARNESARLYRCLARALVTTIEFDQRVEPGHLRRMHDLARALAERLSLPDAECETVGAAGWVHDIGMVEVPPAIRTKAGRLTPPEMERMRAHAIAGARILASLDAPCALAAIVRHHHERWDGSGYPDGLRGEQIPRGARILALVDCFEALTAGRPYRSPVTAEDALDFLRREANRMFEPALIDPFAAVVAERRVRRDAQPFDAARALDVPVTPGRAALLLEARKRVLEGVGAPDALGLLAFEAENARDAEVLVEAARRLEAAVSPGEAVFGLEEGRFVVVTKDGRPRVLASRSLEILRACQHDSLVFRSVQAGYPADGSTAEELLDALDRRLWALASGQGEPAAFPGGRWGTAGVDLEIEPSQR